MDKSMLTEDIDAGFRAWLKGYNLVFCPGIISYELAPNTICDLIHQRTRWSQGWLEVTNKYIISILRSSSITIRQKIICFFLLPYREYHHYLTLNVLTSFLNYYIHTNYLDTKLVLFSIIIPIYECIKILILFLGSYLNKGGISFKQIILYLILVIPYDVFKHIITL